jgi:glyoxylase-like metal-dependent hydrolase (beta-lactamase superfamily II)
MKLLTGDFDVFGDGSATLLSTPGHTPGHQSLLVHLGNTGWVVLTGDAAHFKDNWDNDRVPSINSSPEQTHASHALLAKIIAEKKAHCGSIMICRPSTASSIPLNFTIDFLRPL